MRNETRCWENWNTILTDKSQRLGGDLLTAAGTGPVAGLVVHQVGPVTHATHAPTRTAAWATAAVVLEDAAAAAAHLLGEEHGSLAASAGTDLHEARHADANCKWRRGELSEPLLKMLVRHATFAQQDCSISIYKAFGKHSRSLVFKILFLRTHFPPSRRSLITIFTEIPFFLLHQRRTFFPRQPEDEDKDFF